MSGFAQPVLNAGGHIPADKPFAGPELLAKVDEMLAGGKRNLSGAR